jgi:hypothetical protein
LRRGPRDTATVAVILTIFAIWATIALVGPFAQMGLNESFLLLLTFMLSVSVPSLALSADVEMRRRGEEDLRRIQAELDQRVKDRTAALADANLQLGKANSHHRRQYAAAIPILGLPTPTSSSPKRSGWPILEAGRGTSRKIASAGRTSFTESTGWRAVNLAAPSPIS